MRWQWSLAAALLLLGGPAGARADEAANPPVEGTASQPADGAASQAGVELLAPDDPLNALIQKFHGDYPAQKAASDKLIALGGKAVPCLIQLCSDASDDMRWHAVDLLGAIGDPRALEPLVKCVLEDQNVHVRWRSIWAIGSMDTAAVSEKLLAALKSEDSRIQWNAAVALATMGRGEAVPVLTRGLSDPSEWKQWEAVNGLGSVHDDQTVPALTQKLKSDHPSVAHEAAMSLGRLQDHAAVPALREVLSSPDTDLRWRAAMALERIGGADALKALKQQRGREKDSMVRKQLQQSIRELEKQRSDRSVGSDR
jgi:HEAT repeat protein